MCTFGYGECQFCIYTLIKCITLIGRGYCDCRNHQWNGNTLTTDKTRIIILFRRNKKEARNKTVQRGQIQSALARFYLDLALALSSSVYARFVHNEREEKNVYVKM